MEVTMEIKEVADLVTACENLVYGDWATPTPWFRGHSMGTSWRLLPSVHRGFNHLQETQMCYQFRLKACSRWPRCPAEEDLSGWVSLMRHYGLPTRILDWTESILIAAFFAIGHEEAKGHMEPAVIWALHPRRMNRLLAGLGDIPMFLEKQGRAWVRPAFNQNVEQQGVLAVQPVEIDLRMMLQQSMFTIHGERKALEELPNADVFLRKYEIPLGCRRTVAAGLEMLGIRRSTLFPELEYLAREIVETEKGSLRVPGQ
jgi:hypothetical protein